MDYRIQSAQLGITSPSEFLAALGSNPCDVYTDPEEHATCLQLVSDSQFISDLTGITTEILGAFQTCAANFAAGSPDYQVVINATCPTQNPVRRLARRAGEEVDITQEILEAMERQISAAEFPPAGPEKSLDLIQLARRQTGTCAQTGTCFETCPDCRWQQTVCGTTATVITTAVCAVLAGLANAAAASAAIAACTTACGPAAPFCLAFCPRAAGGLAAAAVGTACAVGRTLICNPLAERCANCNNFNNGICNPNSTQCCAGETGTQCGAGCCCCPRCQAPGGINCECTAAPC